MTMPQNIGVEQINFHDKPPHHKQVPVPSEILDFLAEHQQQEMISLLSQELGTHHFLIKATMKNQLV